MADSDWLEGAELLPLHFGVDTNVLNSAVSAPTVIVSNDLAIVGIEYILGVSPYPSVTQIFDQGFAVITDATIIPPEVIILDQGFDNTGVIFGLMKDPTWVVSFICQQKALQYWG